MVVAGWGAVADRWHQPEPHRGRNSREAESVTDLQVYLLIAPLVLLALGVAAYAWVRYRL
jgi:hypothetical protein